MSGPLLDDDVWYEIDPLSLYFPTVYIWPNKKKKPNKTNHLTYWYAKGVHDGLDETKHKQSAAAHVRQEEHDADAATKLWAESSADHVCKKLRPSAYVKSWFVGQCDIPNTRGVFPQWVRSLVEVFFLFKTLYFREM